MPIDVAMNRHPCRLFDALFDIKPPEQRLDGGLSETRTASCDEYRSREFSAWRDSISALPFLQPVPSIAVTPSGFAMNPHAQSNCELSQVQSGNVKTALSSNSSELIIRCRTVGFWGFTGCKKCKFSEDCTRFVRWPDNRKLLELIKLLILLWMTWKSGGERGDSNPPQSSERRGHLVDLLNTQLLVVYRNKNLLIVLG